MSIDGDKRAGDLSSLMSHDSKEEEEEEALS